MAIKLSQALTLAPEEFAEMCLKNNNKLAQEYPSTAKFMDKHNPVFPSPTVLYDKHFYFMEETIRQRDLRKR